jgi:D-serine deaminase-like pyridoxal phosphate-dependent protein
MKIPSQQVGIQKKDIDTPALVIDLPIMEENIVRMAQFARNQGVNLRPYIKTHKSPILARKQMRAGAVGVGCATIQEAEMMANAGIKDILIGNQVMGPVKIARLMNLAKKADTAVAVDSYSNVDELSAMAKASKAKVRILVELDVGAHRCGIQPGEPALKLAQYVAKAPGLEFCGFMGYESHLQLIADPEEKLARVKKEVGALVETANMAKAAGLNVKIVSASGTLTYKQTGSLPGITEIQPGTYIFMDARYYALQTDFRCALTVLTTIISHPADNYIIVDAGHKALSSDGGMPEVKDLPGAKLVRMWEEHGKIELSQPMPELKVGDKVEIYPSHVCTTVNLHGKYFAIRNDRVEAVWETFTRHKLS